MHRIPVRRGAPPCVRSLVCPTKASSGESGSRTSTAAGWTRRSSSSGWRRCRSRSVPTTTAPSAAGGSNAGPKRESPRSHIPPSEDRGAGGARGAGKSRSAEEYVGRGSLRLNRDERTGSLRDLAGALDEQLGAGVRRVVLDNTYLTRAARSYVIDVAARHDVAARCIWL